MFSTFCHPVNSITAEFSIINMRTDRGRLMCTHWHTIVLLLLLLVKHATEAWTDMEHVIGSYHEWTGQLYSLRDHPLQDRLFHWTRSGSVAGHCSMCGDSLRQAGQPLPPHPNTKVYSYTPTLGSGLAGVIPLDLLNLSVDAMGSCLFRAGTLWFNRKFQELLTST